MKSRFVTTLIVAAAMTVAVPSAFAQEIHKDPSSHGTTGLFTVPLASVLEAGQFSAGVYYSAIAMEAGDSAIETLGLAGGFAFAAAPGLEIFGSFEPRVGIDRDSLVEIAQGGSLADAARLDNHPFAADGWQTGIGDLRLGGKYKFWGDLDAYDGIAFIGELKLPTSDTDAGIGTGKFDASLGIVASGEAAEMVGITGYVGGTLKSSPDEFDVGNEFNYGFGVQAPTRFWISGIFEVSGAIVSDPSSSTLPAVAGDDPAILMGGFRVSHPIGLSWDAAYTYNATFDTPSGLGDLPVREGGWFTKIAYTSSRREPVVLIGAAPMALPPVNRPPTITCRAERTSVREGESVRLFATVSDPDNDAMTVTWNTQAGSLTPREGETVTWSSQGVRPGSGPIAVRVSDGYGGTADCNLTITVTAPPPPPTPTILTFACGEFPSGNTRIDNRCKAILDDVALQLRQNPRATAVITGHSDSAGAADVNQRMSQERADNAETYLVDTHGIDGSRITTAGAGSAEPVADNDTAEGRLQNRRIQVVVTIPAQ